jgi:hypothetical protein
MSNQSLLEVLQQLEKVFKDKPNYNKVPGGAGYRNGYEDGYKLAVKRFKTFSDELLKKSSDSK